MIIIPSVCTSICDCNHVVRDADDEYHGTDQCTIMTTPTAATAPSLVMVYPLLAVMFNDMQCIPQVLQQKPIMVNVTATSHPIPYKCCHDDILLGTTLNC